MNQPVSFVAHFSQRQIDSSEQIVHVRATRDKKQEKIGEN